RRPSPLSLYPYATLFRSREQLIGLGIAIIGATILLVVLYAVFRRAPRTWWIWGTVVAVIFSFVLVFIAPVFIEPLFNTYKPLTKDRKSTRLNSSHEWISY